MGRVRVSFEGAFDDSDRVVRFGVLLNVIVSKLGDIISLLFLFICGVLIFLGD